MKKTNSNLSSSSLIHFFFQAEDLNATQEIDLQDDQMAGEGSPMKLNFVKFQYVSNLTIFIGENKGGDTTQISRLSLFGSPVLQMNMSDFKKQG